MTAPALPHRRKRKASSGPTPSCPAQGRARGLADADHSPTNPTSAERIPTVPTAVGRGFPAAGWIDPRPILGLGLPAHVFIQFGDGWVPAWLIGRVHCENGWMALVQCADATGREQTLRLPVHQVTVGQPG